jgi:protein TonB
MKFSVVFGVLCAVMLHGGFIAFGGLVFPKAKEDHGTTREVELLSDESVEDEKKKDEPEPEKTEKTEDLEVEEEAPPDAAELMKSLDLSPLASAPALDAASLSAIEAALSGQAGLGDFAQSLSFASGGIIGGTGSASAIDEDDNTAFSLAEIDQPPRVVLQGAPLYPSTMRGKKVEGVVVLIFIVDANGKVVSPRVESSTHSNFEAPALDAVKKWKFEPGVRAGKTVPCRMRIPVRFPTS